MKLYPPIIEGTVPAFTGSKLIVPFTMNKSVSEREIKGFCLKLKTVQSNYFPFGPIKAGLDNWNKETNEITFTLPNLLNIGQFYKIQIAYVDTSDTIGYYSTVGVVKCTSEPKISIQDPSSDNTYIGIYSQEAVDENDIRDYTEKVYSYTFTLTDELGNVIETSGEQTHNSSTDIFIYESTDAYTLKTELKEDKMYYLDYSIKTINGMVRSAQTRYIFKIGSIDSKLKTNLTCKLNHEDGYIDISLTKPEDMEVEESAVGSFYLLRASDEDNFNSWHEILKFVLQGQQPSRHLWKDMTVKQGVEYKYAIQQFNEHKLRSNKIESNIVKADFDHAYLYDGERQLKIKYNPKVSSFKNTLLESKIDTIGSKHPFIFRNGRVNYKEFPISGLISYLSDENDLFYPNSHYFNESELNRTETVNRQQKKVNEWVDEETYIKNREYYYCLINGKYISFVDYVKSKDANKNTKDYYQIRSELFKIFNENALYFEKKAENIKVRTTNLTADNILIERNFKLEVLEWLTNGKPKLFRSPAEGNYIVRLMNVSLTPTDSLSRMIHTFNCTAYEIAENDYVNLEKYDFIKVNNVIEPELRWLSVDLAKHKVANNVNLLHTTASSIYLEGLLPGDKFEITTLKEEKPIVYSIVIGATGRYIIDLDNNVKIISLTFKGDNNLGEIYHQGMLTYGYYSDDYKDSFDTINKIERCLVPCQQFIGEHEDIISEIETVKDKIDTIGFIRFSLRDDEIEVYKVGGKYYSDSEASNEIDLVDLTNIYKVYLSYNLVNGKKIWNVNDYEWFDGYNNCSLGRECAEEHTKIYINGLEECIDLKDTTFYELRAVPAITSLKTGAAIITEICYTKKVLNYDLEEDVNVKTAKAEYDAQLANLNNAILNGTATRVELKQFQDACQIAYKTYTDTLDLAIKGAERR